MTGHGSQQVDVSADRGPGTGEMITESDDSRGFVAIVDVVTASN